ncbi:polysaccharide biosynthesis tyrosine autokinase [Hymenobacter setariae]|uniref:non-specific protein-tyrosine kinase n=1 Tax=Hymenobacter setariae TaxID=2594794 RepID=A0A558BYD6_9BACT|nr:tyrosine-protein kinase family protein [Hymenobacter setariae]TVT41509.1 polysaccharide biosynthesis tyrosine autokinase [Hymenobacter setariae]
MAAELFPLKSEQPKGKDLKFILQRYLRFWYLFVLGAVIALAAAYTYLRYYAVAEYEVSSTLLIKNESSKPELSGLNGISGSELGEGGSDLNNEIQVLKSKSLMERVVTDLAFFSSYYIKGKIRDVEVYGKTSPITMVISKLTPSAYGKVIVIRLKPNNEFSLTEEGSQTSTNHKLGQLINKPYGAFTIVATPYNTGADKLFSKDILVQFHDIKNVAAGLNGALKIMPISKESTILQVSLVDAVPERGKDVINKLIEIYNHEALEYKNRNATNTINFLDDRLKGITSELSGVERGVENFKRQNEVADVSSQASNYINQASTYNKQLSDWAIQIDVLESIERYLNKTTGQYSMVPSSLGIQDPTLVGLIEKFNGLQLERERMLRTMEVDNPLIQNINEQLANLRTNILENLQNIKRGLVITSRNLKASSGQFQSQIKKVPSIERQLLEINRQQDVKRSLYSFLLQKREEAALELAATVSNSRIIDPALSGDYPIAPKVQLVYLIALLLGLSIPFLGIYVKELMNDKIQNVQDIEELTNTPILGELLLNNKREALVVTKSNRTPIAEMFRLIRANLNYLMFKKDNKVILVTSSMSGEGKTFFSLNFAASLLLIDKKVVLLELDLRNSDLSHILGLTDNLGVTDYLSSDKVNINDIIQQSDAIPGLHVISSGPRPVNPAELLMSAKLTYLIEELREAYDYIILDTAPVGKVSDVFGLAPLVDSGIYLVRCNYTYKRMVNIVDKIYNSNKINNMMIVVNGTKAGDNDSYGYGYGEQTKKSSLVLK